MEASTAKRSPGSKDPEEPKEPTGVEKASDDTLDHREDITAEEDHVATKWFLDPQPEAPEWDIEFDWFAHGKGDLVKHTWTVKPLPPEALEAIEKKNTDERTGMVDSSANNAEVLSAASIEPDPTSEEFRRANGDRASAPEAIRYLFRHQGGVVDFLAGEVRRISGFDPTRVGKAKPRLSRAAGNS